MRMSLKTLFATTFLMTATIMPAYAQDSDMQALVDRLERMDRDIKALNLKVYRGTNVPAVSGGGEDVSGPLGARLSIRINELENQLRQMTGQIEETAFRISQLTTRLDKLVADVDYRLTALEGGTPNGVTAQPNEAGTQGESVANLPNGVSGEQLQPPGPSGQEAAETQQTTPAGSQPGVLGTLEEKDLTNPTLSQKPLENTPTTGQVEQQQAALTPKAMYESSRQMLMRGEFADAEKSFKTFLEENREHELTGNARYWLGETYYVQGNYAQAAATFLEGYQKDARGAKAPDSLLKLGMSLKRMDKKREACAAFGKLRADFPKLPAHLSKTLERERTAAQCS